MLRTFALLLAPLMTVGLIYAFGWWTLLVMLALMAATFVFSMRKGTDEDLAMSGAGHTSFGTPTTFIAQLK